MGCCDSRPKDAIFDKNRPKTKPLVKETSKIKGSNSFASTKNSDSIDSLKSSGLRRSTFITTNTASIRDFYETVKKICMGTHGDIILAKDKRTGLYRVIKEIRKSDLKLTSSESFLQEIEILKELVTFNIGSSKHNTAHWSP